MTHTETDMGLDRHSRQVEAVTNAVGKLLVLLGPQGFTPEAVFEGAVKGGSVAMMAATPATAKDIAALLKDLAAAFEDLGAPDLRLVQ